MQEVNINLKEIWKDIKGYEGKYQISSLGRVKSLERYIGKRLIKECIKSMRPDKDGYLFVDLHKDGKEKRLYVHRLVALTFIPNDNPIVKFQVNHKDENKKNNCVDNLEWCSNEYNYSYNNFSARKRSQEVRESKRINGILKNKRSRKVLQLNPYTMDVIKEYETLTDVSKQTGYSVGTIHTSCSKGTINYGFKWRFKERDIA